MSSAIFCALRNKGMFPTDSKIPSILNQCYGNGYKALKLIIFHSHPVFHDQPVMLIMTYPKQCANHSLTEYHALFWDYLQLCAFINNVDASLDNTNELDMFITNAKHGVWLNSQTQDEHQKPSYAD
jgi:hypothetical protein